MNNNVNNTNKTPSVTEATKQLGTAVWNLGGAIWNNTGGKIIGGMSSVVQSLTEGGKSFSGYSGDEGIDDLPKINIENRHVGKKDERIENNNNNNNRDLVNPEIKEIIISKNNKLENIPELVEEIMKHKGGMKIKCDGMLSTVGFGISHLFVGLEKYVNENECEFPRIRELQVASLSVEDLTQLSRNAESRLERNEDVRKVRMLKEFDLGKIERLVVKELKLIGTLKSNSGQWLHDITFDARIFSSLKEVKIVNITYKGENLGDLFSKNNGVAGLNFKFWISHECYGLSKIKKIFLPKFIVEKFSALSSDYDYDQSFICGLRGNGCSRVLDKYKNDRYISSSHTSTALLVEKNEFTGTESGNETDIVEFIFEDKGEKIML